VRSNGHRGPDLRPRSRSKLSPKWTALLNLAVKETLSKQGLTLYAAAKELGINPVAVYGRNMGIVRANAVLSTVGHKLEFRIVRAR
jgi:hypothetical protein